LIGRYIDNVVVHAVVLVILILPSIFPPAVITFLNRKYQDGQEREGGREKRIRVEKLDTSISSGIPKRKVKSRLFSPFSVNLGENILTSTGYPDHHRFFCM
jgi:hypothetical protein